MKTLYRASLVHTLSHPATGEWLLVDGRHVERVGSGEPPAADRTVDLPGATVIPGFIDAHVHLTGTGIHHAGPQLGEARSAGELLELLASGATEAGEALLANGFDESTWPAPELPSIDELDRVSTKPVIAVRADGHLSLVNTTAIEASGALDRSGVDMNEAGTPAGTVRREANARVQEWFHRNLP